MFSFKTFIGISELCDIFTFVLNCNNAWMFLYFKIAFKFASLVLLTNGSSFEYLEISRFCTILEKSYI